MQTAAIGFGLRLAYLTINHAAISSDPDLIHPGEAMRSPAVPPRDAQ
jgi:hypothetical protein